MIRTRVLQQVACWVLCFLMAVPSSFGQDAGQAAMEADLAEGVRLLKAADVEAALDYLEEVMEMQPAYVSATHGAGAYWLGKAYQTLEDEESALDVWTEGLDALNEAGLFDIRLSDAFIHQLYAFFDTRAVPGRDQTRASQAYLQLLSSLDGEMPDDLFELLRVHLEALVFVLPEDLRQASGLHQLDKMRSANFPEGTGADLVTWWRSQDVAPATRYNERLNEHLRRMVRSVAKYRYKEGFDDRGGVYIRLGEPSLNQEINFDDSNFRRKVLDRSPTLMIADFPVGELWVYEHIDDWAQFLFVNKTGHFELGEIRDFLPPSLLNAGPTGREERTSKALLRTLTEIHRQMAAYHPMYAARYADYVAWEGHLDDSEFAVETLGEGAALEVDDAQMFSIERLYLQLPRLISQAQAEEEQARVQREDHVPQSYTNVFDEAEPLPTLVRMARFLDDDGTTRTEIYWGAPVDALKPSHRMIRSLRRDDHLLNDYLLMTTVVQKTADFQDRIVHHHRHLLRDLNTGSDVSIAPQTYVVNGDTGRYHLALQWDQYLTTVDDETGKPATLGPRIKVNTFASDTLEALQADERFLEMSDLQPLSVLGNQERGASMEDLLAAATVYPLTEITKDTPLFLSFEVYHLRFGENDQTDFSATYEITRERGLLRRDQTISGRTDYSGTSQTAREAIMLDLSDWSREGDLYVTVRITDNVSGQEVERSLPFRLVKR